MNPETPGEPGRAEPREEPAVVGAAIAPQPTATDAAPTPSVDAEAPDTVPDELRELPPELPPEPRATAPTEEAESAVASEAAAAGAANTPGLTPAACGLRLAELFPALFIAPGAPGPAKPIKLRIHADIQARAPGVFSKRVLGLFFSRYTTTNAYLKALAGSPHRFDLDGQAAGEIAAEHRQAATEELARRHALAAERRAAQRPAPRREAPPAEGDARAQAPREAQAPRRAGQHPGAGPERAARPPRDERQRPERPPGARASAPIDRPPRPREHPAHAQRPEPVRATPPPAALPAAVPTDPAQRERAMLMRSFESSPLSKANFCALKGITEAALDAALQQAQAERRGPGR